MTRGAKVAVGLVLTPILVLFLVIGALLLFDWNWIKGEVERAVGASINREVSLGRIDVDWGWTTVIRAGDVRIGNTDWGQVDWMATLQSLELAVELAPLVHGRIVLPRLTASSPELALERNSDGAVNWSFAGPGGEVAGAVTPDERTEFPTIGQMRVVDGHLSYRDAIRGMDLTGHIATASGDAEGEDALTLSLKGALAGNDLSVEFRGGSLLHLREPERPYPVRLDIVAGDTVLEIEGKVVEPLAIRALDARFHIQGATMAEIYLVTGIPLPDTPPYALSGNLTRDDAVWRLTDFDGRVGDSDLSGTASIDPAGERPSFRGDLVSRRLDFDDLAGFIGAEPDVSETANAEQRKNTDQSDVRSDTLPDTPIASDRLRAMDMDVRFHGQEVMAPNLPIEELKAHLVLTDGRAVLDPLQMSVADGKVDATIDLDARRDLPIARLTAAVERLNMKPFFEGTDFIQQMGGRFYGDVTLEGQGKSLAAMMAEAEGDGWLGLRDGAISGLLVEAAGADIIESLAILVTEDARIPVRCGRAKVTAEAGTIVARQVVVDTVDSVLLARGHASMADETVDFQIEARPKDFSLIDLASPVYVRGAWHDPSVGLGDLDPLPFMELGEAQDIDCDALMAGEWITVSPDTPN